MGRTDSGHEKRVKEGGEEADDATRELKLSVLTIYFFYSPGFLPIIFILANNILVVSTCMCYGFCFRSFLGRRTEVRSF